MVLSIFSSGPRKTYWVYSNGAWETQTVTYPSDRGAYGPHTHHYRRQITGPIPLEDIAPLVRHIHPYTPNWRQQLEQILEDNYFQTTRIADGVPVEKGVTAKAFIKEKVLTRKNVAAVAILATAYFYPGVSKVIKDKTPLPTSLKGVANMTQKVIINSNAYFGKMAAQVNAKAVAGTIFILGTSQVQIGKVVVSGISSATLLAIVQKSAERVWSNYNEWRRALFQVFEDTKDEAIPTDFEQDPVFSQENTCDISFGLVRHPCRVYGKLYDKTNIVGWLRTRVDLGEENPLDPYRIGPLNIEVIERGTDSALSDQIELRLLLLKSIGAAAYRALQPAAVQAQPPPPVPPPEAANEAAPAGDAPAEEPLSPVQEAAEPPGLREKREEVIQIQILTPPDLGAGERPFPLLGVQAHGVQQLIEVRVDPGAPAEARISTPSPDPEQIRIATIPTAFRKYFKLPDYPQCPITGEPIRYLSGVRDEQGQLTYFERDALALAFQEDLLRPPRGWPSSVPYDNRFVSNPENDHQLETVQQRITQRLNALYEELEANLMAEDAGLEGRIGEGDWEKVYSLTYEQTAENLLAQK